MAQRLLMAGQVRVDGQLVDKASATVPADAAVEVRALPRFVSRAGDKLANALEDLLDARRAGSLEVAGRHAIDVGASTGGFSDCLLQEGASAVVALDVGHGQLHPRVREDERVTVLERTNARDVTRGLLPFEPDLLVCDVSFISVLVALPPVLACMAPDWWGVVLCKPQFEVGRGGVGRGGVVRDETVRAAARERVIEGLASHGATTHAWQPARPQGRKGNVEYALLVGPRADANRRPDTLLT